MGSETKETPPGFLLDCARFYRGLGFFTGHAALTDEQLAAELERMRTDDWEWHLDPSAIMDQMVLASWDKDRVWWEDAFEWLGDMDTMYADALQGWARISRGAFHPTEITESWAGPDGPVSVEFAMDGVRYRMEPEASGETLDIEILGPINGLMAPTGLRFVDVDTGDQTMYLVAIREAEKSALAGRGWPILDDFPVAAPPPVASARRQTHSPPPEKKGWFSKK